MRTAVMVVALGACMHRLPATPVEQCAAQGMVLEGLAMSSGTSHAVAANSQGGLVGVGVTSSDETVNCRRPSTTRDACEIKAAQESLEERAAYGVFGRNVVLGVGYAILIVPGILLWFAFDGERDGIAAGANQIYSADMMSCE